MTVDTRPMPEFTSTDINRFWSKVLFTANAEKCWEWNCSKRKGGYGYFTITLLKKQVKLVSTRVSYFLTCKIDPVGFAILHKCDNPMCCNPEHLFIGTNKDNTQDMISKGRKADTSGVNNGTSKLDEFQVIEIRNLYNTKQFLQNELANKFNVSVSTIQRVVTNMSWKTVK